MDITIKNKIAQFFCEHRNAGWYRDDSATFQIVSGERHFKICRDCGKVLDERFQDYEGNGFK